MNKRIKKLVDQCWANTGPVVFNKEFNKEKFAELIVRECMAQCEQVAAEADSMTKSEFVTDAGRMLHEGMWGGAKNCSGQIQTHFGVKE
jgi:hypothetical protein